MADTLDSDIAQMNLSEGEKWGLQVYRNYSKKFGDYRVKQFVEERCSFETDVDMFEKIASLVVSKELRALPVIASSYVDDCLRQMFKREVPDGVPGGRNSLMSGFGPLARFSQRLQMAYAFGWLSKDLIAEFDSTRKIRNELSHNWDMTFLEQRVTEFIEKKLQLGGDRFIDGILFSSDFDTQVSTQDRYRIRLIWMLGRLTYETRLWVPALKAGIAPTDALYGPYRPTMLRLISTVCLEKTRLALADNAHLIC